MLKNKISILKLFMLTLLFPVFQNTYAQEVSGTPVTESGNSGKIVVAVIIIAVAILYMVLKRLGYFGTKGTSESIEIQPAAAPELIQDGLSGEVTAAIVMAMYLYSSEIHDQEDPVITMIRVSRTYSPWSSKIYGLRKSPR